MNRPDELGEVAVEAFVVPNTPTCVQVGGLAGGLPLISLPRLLSGQEKKRFEQSQSHITLFEYTDTKGVEQNHELANENSQFGPRPRLSRPRCFAQIEIEARSCPHDGNWTRHGTAQGEMRTPRAACWEHSSVALRSTLELQKNFLKSNKITSPSRHERRESKF